MNRWRESPDYGWRAMYDSGPNVVAEVFGRGWQSGLRAGDRVLAINGSVYDTFDELFFSLRNPLLGGLNTYTVTRNGHLVDITIKNGRLGFPSVLRRSGPLFAVGFLYASIGILVFFMKNFIVKNPVYLQESRIFLLMTVTLGVSISYASPSDLLEPLWLFDVRQFLDVFLPAPMIHLALIFPRPHGLLDRFPRLWMVPYGISLLLFFLFESLSTAYWNSPPLLNTINGLYLLSAVLIFVVSTVWNLIRDSKPLIRRQSQVIFFGILVGFLIPSSELFGRNVLGVHVFGDPTIYFAFFLTAFPLAVGYTIIRFNYFTVDTMVRRTYGYGVSMAIVVGTFAGVVALLNFAFSGLDVWRTPTFSLFFAVAVVIFFGPLHAKVQELVNRLFYRGRIDYKDAVASVSNALTSVLETDQVILRIIHTVRKIMLIDSAGVLLRNPGNGSFSVLILREPEVIGEEEKPFETILDSEDPLIAPVLKEGKMVSIYDLGKAIGHEGADTQYGQRFEELGISLVVPMIFKGEIVGMLTVGRKKSGRLFNKEDIDLLTTLASQGAIAIENARMAEKMRDEEIVRTNLARYLSPQVVEQVISRNVGVALGGERKEVTVLISDIRGFTEITETQPPDRLVSILNEYFTEMAGIIFDWNGSLDKYIGDSIVSVFGGLEECKDPAGSAVGASLAMMRRMGELNGKWDVKYSGFRMEIGIGIDRGEVFLGNVGSPDRMEFTVLGKTVNTASALSEVAEPGQILITEATAGNIGEGFSLRKVPPVRAKKKNGQIKVFEVLYL